MNLNLKLNSLTNSSLQSLSEGDGPITALALHRPRGAGDDLVYAAGGVDGKIQLFQGSNLTPLSSVEGHGVGCVVTSLVVDDAGRFLVSGAKMSGDVGGDNGVAMAVKNDIR